MCCYVQHIINFNVRTYMLHFLLAATKCSAEILNANFAKLNCALILVHLQYIVQCYMGLCTF